MKINGPTTCVSGDISSKLPSDLSDIALQKIALSIAVNTLSQLSSADVDGSDDFDIVRRYIQVCPFVPLNSPAVKAALDGLERYGCNTNHAIRDTGILTNSFNTIEGSAPPHLFEDGDSSVDTIEDNSVGPIRYQFKEISKKNKQKTNTETAFPIPAAKRKTLWLFLGYLLRTTLMDFPLMLIFVTYASCLWVHYVHDKYLAPQLEAFYFSEERSMAEHTYYKRPCDESDITTSNAADLILPTNATAQDAYEVQLKHGFTMFPLVLTPETSTNLRNYVLSRNRKLSEQEKIFVIEGDNRYSFALGTEEPTVASAVMEIANHERLRSAMEKILGPNPALIELTAITNAYGAVEQYWHDDVIPSASAINFGRTFGPSYSVFIQLQNTTKEMGATEACPGTHYCSDGPIATSCEVAGFQVVDESDGYWHAGDALLMNMNSYHRGQAHTDPDAGDRVMMILTFVPKPKSRAETRQLSEGITFSLRWDLWGHTLNDLAQADKVMTQPWATLRSLGLYKPSNAEWGIDYVTSASMRMANGDNGFNPYALEKHLELGGFAYLPKFLEAPVNDDYSWHDYLLGTLVNCENFMATASIVSAGVYMAVAILMNCLPGKRDRLNKMGWTLIRFSMICGLAVSTFVLAIRHVDNTDWALDIRNQVRYTSTVDSEVAFAREDNSPLTFPTKYDVLVETRYGSSELAMYNDFINGHPGNRYLQNLIDAVAGTYKDYPSLFQDAAATYILTAIHANYGRMLHQTPDGAWFLMNSQQAWNYVKDQLSIHSRSSNHLLHVSRTLRFLMSDLKYGIFRRSVLSRKHGAKYLKFWEDKLMKPNRATPPRTPARSIHMQYRSFSLTTVPSLRRNIRLHSPRIWGSVRKVEPFDGAWLGQGDLCEGYEHQRWYPGRIDAISAHGWIDVSFFDGDQRTLDTYTVRRFIPYQAGERIDCMVNGVYQPCEVIGPQGIGFYNAFLLENGFYIDEIFPGQMRRLGSPTNEQHTYKAAY